MSRRQHILGAARSDSVPAQVVVLETDAIETGTGQPVSAVSEALGAWHAIAFSGAKGVYGVNIHLSGTEAGPFWAGLLPRLKKGGLLWVFGSGICRTLTLVGLWENLENGRLSLSRTEHRAEIPKLTRGSAQRNALAILEDPPTILDCRAPGLSGTLRFVDVANYGLTSVDGWEDAAQRVERCAAFVRQMLSAIQTYQLGSLQCTAGSQSMVAWKRSSMTHTVLVHDNPAATGIEDAAYYGGRCEAFRLGALPDRVWHLDVSAMYPYCYGANDVPVCLLGTSNDIGVSDIEQLSEEYGVIADVLIKTDTADCPYRDEQNRITIWPVGCFRSAIAGPELSDALGRGRVAGVYRAAWYQLKPALQAYSDKMRNMRRGLELERDAKAWAKALAVCVVGKLGQRSRSWVDGASTNVHGPWAQWWQQGVGEPAARWRSIAGHQQREVISGFGFDAVPSVAAWITSLARVRLLSIIRAAGWHNVYYCDTDSVMVNEAGRDNLERHGWLREAEWGFLRVKRYSDRVSIRGIKSYVEDGEETQAGRSMQAPRIRGCPGETWVRPHILSSLRTGSAPVARRHRTTFGDVGRYRHGVRNADGTVSPFWLGR